MNWILEPWPWYVGGPLVALIMFLLIFGGKNFGMSANLRTICSIGGGGKFADFFNFDWKKQSWNMFVLLGSIIGGYIASQFLLNSGVTVSDSTVQALKDLNIDSTGEEYLPSEIFGLGALKTVKGWLILIAGGLMIGFGARYAGGCTSGHAISGLSDFQLPSLIAVIGFFIGGLVMTHLIIPMVF